MCGFFYKLCLSSLRLCARWLRSLRSCVCPSFHPSFLLSFPSFSLVAPICSRVFTDGSTKEVTEMGGSRIYITHPSANTETHSVAAGETSTSFRAEATAPLAAMQALNILVELTAQKNHISTKSNSVLQAIPFPKQDSIINKIKKRN